MYKPSIPTSIGFAVGATGYADHYYLGTGWSSTNPLGLITSPPILRAGSNFGTAIASDPATPTNVDLLLPRGTSPGNFCVELIWVGSVAAVVGGPLITCSLFNGLTGQVVSLANLANGGGSQTGSDAASQRTLFIHKSFTIQSELLADHYIHVQTGQVLPGTPTFGEVFIYRMPALLLT